MSDLERCMAGQVLAFKESGEGDQLFSRTVVVEVTDTDGSEIEFALDMPNSKQRLYLRLPMDRVLRAITERDEDPTP